MYLYTTCKVLVC